jgi:hypothetical protein
MPLFRHSKDTTSEAADVRPVTSPAGGDQITSALERFSALSVSERAAEVLAEIGPRLTAAWDGVDWSSLDRPRTDMNTLLEPLVPDVRYKELSLEQRRNAASLRWTLAEAFQALVLSRLLIRQDPSGSQHSEASYANSPDGLAALQRDDVAAVVARRLPE